MVSSTQGGAQMGTSDDQAGQKDLENVLELLDELAGGPAIPVQYPDFEPVLRAIRERFTD